jgi:YggT family protein
MGLVLYKFIDIFFQFLYMALMARVFLSWIPHNPQSAIIQFLHQVTDPILRPFQDIVPSWRIGLDLAPLFAFFAIGIVRKLLLQLLF